MDAFVARLLVYTALPLILGAVAVARMGLRDDRPVAVEAFLIPMFILGAGNGIGGFFSHYFLGDEIAASIGWPPGSPFQKEVAFANLGIGIAGAVAAGRRDGFREATVLVASVFAFGATIVHVTDIVETGNLAPGNTVQNVANVLRPGILIWLLVLSRRAERTVGGTDSPEFQALTRTLIGASVVAMVIASTAFGTGFAMGTSIVVSILGALLATVVFTLMLRTRKGA
ncbi:MAG: hypothetical protein KDC98_00515 [Planctomycetes bacterium]|nr:hypothetical protein [Planctomycetota bacterium]